MSHTAKLDSPSGRLGVELNVVDRCIVVRAWTRLAGRVEDVVRFPSQSLVCVFLLRGC